MKTPMTIIFLSVVVIFFTTSCSCYFSCKKRSTTIPSQEKEIEKLKDNFTFIFDMDSANQDQVLYISQGKGKNFVLFLKALEMNPARDSISKFRFTLFNRNESYYKIGKIEQPIQHPTHSGSGRKIEIKISFVKGGCDTPFFQNGKTTSLKIPKIISKEMIL